MPIRGRVALVACEPCRRRKVKCDGATPVCSACHNRPLQCSYTSEPGVPRSVALKVEYEEMKSSYNNLSRLHERLKRGSTSEVSALIERIRLEDEVPDMPEDDGMVGRPMEDTQSPVYGPRLAGENGGFQADFAVLPEQASSSLPHHTLEPSSSSWWTDPIDTGLDVELDRYDSTISPPTAFLRGPGNGAGKVSASLQRDLLSPISVPHKVLLWPVVFDHVMESGIAVAALDLHCIRSQGSSWLWQREMCKRREKILGDDGLLRLTHQTASTIFPNLTTAQVKDYSTAYFNTFNVLLPLLHLNVFMDGVGARILQGGYRDNDPKGVLVLLVLALGQLAIEGVLDHPTSVNSGEYSGFRGGTVETPPGLKLFNEARRRLGIFDTECHLENVRIRLLQATYFEASARHSEFWRSISAASVACMSLIRTGQIDWSSSYGDLVKRAYWICVLQERLFDLDLRVASTGIEDMKDQVPLPRFQGTLEEEGQSKSPASESSGASAVSRRDDYAYHFIAMIALSRLMRRADHVIHGHEPSTGEAEPLSKGPSQQAHAGASVSGTLTGHYNGPPSSLIQELLRQLDCWRDVLPQRLQWSDDERFGFMHIEPIATVPQTSFFSALRNVGPGIIDHNMDIAVAQLRTRFYHARFLINRPFIYKALHARELMTAYDRAGCALAISAACFWPLSLAPPKNKKYLVPHLFSWTQNFLGMVLILQMCRNDRYLCEICKDGGVATEDIESSIGLMIGWLEDMKQVDGIAEWSVRVLGPFLYSGRETRGASSERQFM